MSSGKGTTRTSDITDGAWKNTDDAKTSGGGTAYSASPIVAGSNSYTKYVFGKFSGTFNQILNCKWGHSSGTFGTGLTLKGVVTSTYATPSTTTNASLTTDMTSAITVSSSGASVNFHTTGPEGSSPTSTLSATGYTQYLASQLQTTGSAGPGDVGSISMQLVYDEN